MSVSLGVMVLMVMVYLVASSTPFYIHHSGIGEQQTAPPGRELLSGALGVRCYHI